MDKAPGRIQINSGVYKGTVLKVPDAVVRPTPLMVRQAMFNSLQGSLNEGPFLDLFAGSGAMGLEALSRGAPTCVLVESGHDELSALRQSLAKMRLDNTPLAILFPMDVNKALAILAKQKRLFRFIFIDPPYEQWEAPEKLSWLSRLASILQADGQVICQRDKTQKVVTIPGLSFYDTRIYGRSALDFYQFSPEDQNAQ